MNIVITGTPGVGKTAVSKQLSEKMDATHIDINRLIEQEGIYEETNEELKTKMVDIEKLAPLVKKHVENVEGDVILDSHLAHKLPKEIVDVVFVLRTKPEELEKRLKEKGFSKKKIEENLEAEVVDVCLIEALERHKEVHEIDTTNKRSEEVAEQIIECLKDKRNLKPGNIDWSNYLLQNR